MISLTGYTLLKIVPNNYGTNVYSLKKGDIIKARPSCECDMSGYTVEVIEVFSPQNKKGYKTKVLEVNRDLHEINHPEGQIWNMVYMKGRIHSGCNVYRRTKINNWKEVIER